MNVLVTGGAGYIGSHACKALASAGHKPVVFDSLERGHREFVKWGPLVQGRIQDREKVARALREHKIDAVMHFAAYAFVEESVRNPALYYENNFAGTMGLLGEMLTANVKRFVFSSTCAVYGIPSRVPIDENNAFNPINPYGASKAMVERLLQDFARAHGLRSVSLRYFNAAGGDSEAQVGERHDPETHLIPLALRAAGTGAELQIFGNDYPTPDGTCVRDYIHVADLASAHVAALEKMDGFSSLSEAFNLGTGRGYSVQEIVETIERVTGKKLTKRIRDRRAGDPPQLVANPAKAASALEWIPKAEGLEPIIETAWTWYRKEMERGYV